MIPLRLSVVVPTRNRPRDAESCVRSILANARDDFELAVVDQSGDEETKGALRTFASDPRFRYVHTDTRGASRSRNVGIASTSAPLIAFTDDDCEVPPDWVDRLLTLFDSDPEAALVFGRVRVPPEVDGKSRYAAQFEPGVREYRHRFPPSNVPWGIGANMAARRATLDRVGTFDPLLGPGAPFPAAEEYDLAIRVLAAGMKVVNAAEVSVLHLGVREGAVASALVYGYGVAIGAALAKHVRLGTKNGARMLTDWVARHGAAAARNVVLRRRPTNVRFVGGLLAGIVRSSARRVDAQRFIYEEG